MLFLALAAAISVYDASPPATDIIRLPDPGVNRLVAESCTRSRMTTKDADGVSRDYILRRCVARYASDPRHPDEAGVTVVSSTTPKGDVVLLVPPGK